LRIVDPIGRKGRTMTETTTLPARVGTDDPVTLEDDATPLVRLVGRALRASVSDGHVPDAFDLLSGTVAVRSHDTPQTATIRFDRGTAAVSSGVLVQPDATLVVDLHARFAPTEEPSGAAALASAALTVLQPPLPPWREAAAQFWETARVVTGIPDVLVVEAHGPDGPQHGRFGEGTTTYGIAGPADLLAGVFSGADDFLVALAAGLQVRGTLSQLSVMTAASWKVRFDV
jgi:hypothetical protein